MSIDMVCRLKKNTGVRMCVCASVRVYAYVCVYICIHVPYMCVCVCIRELHPVRAP